jgi:peptidoglycan glycosyltransferase
MALVAAGIANGGAIRAPYLMDEVRDRKGAVLDRSAPRTWKRATSPEVAGRVRDLMIEAVASGTGTRAALPGVQVAGKTGTAQTGTQRSHAWMIAFAPALAPTVAVAVIVEDQPEVSTATGGRVAAPIVAAVIQSALSGGQ